MSVGGSLVRLARRAGGVRRASAAVRKPAVGVRAIEVSLEL